MAEGRAKGAAGGDWVLGTMSGTSLDGVDAALVLTDGRDVFAFGANAYRPYSAPEQALLRQALGAWPGDAAVPPAEAVIESAHAALIAPFLAGAPRPRLIGFHGQTLAHDPGGRGTHQAGSGARLATQLGLPVAWDFRTADVAAGGQGAPLVPFFHHACARHLGLTAPVLFLNLGGVGNLTWADPRREDPALPGACLAFDTGPANAPINDLMAARRGLQHDEGGALAAKGQVAPEVIAAFRAVPFFAKAPPKALDRDAFAWLQKAVAHLSDEDAAATLTAAAAEAVAAAFPHLPARPSAVYVSGGGRLNGALMAQLAARLALPVQKVEALGLDGDMLEAQAFAYLAARVLRGLPLSAPQTTGVPAPQKGGKISRPSAPLPDAAPKASPYRE